MQKKNGDKLSNRLLDPDFREKTQTFSEFSTTTTFDQKAQEMEKKVHNVRNIFIF